MDDDLTPMEQAPELDTYAAPPKRSRAVASSKRGRLVVGALLFVFVVAAAAVLFLLFSQSSSAPSGSDVAAAPAAPGGELAQATTPAPEAADVPAEPAQVPLTEVFTFRDIFESLVTPASTTGSSGDAGTTTTPGGDSGTDGNGSGASANSILLQDITVENGEPTAVIVWEGQTYNAQEGDQIGDSPWQVLDIRESSVVMLYGDTQVVLSVGQQVSK